MKLMTELNWPEASSKIDYDSRVMLLGSCFAENISRKFDYFKFRSLANPFGIIYHPAPIHYLLRLAQLGDQFPEEGLLQRDGRWYNHFAHSSINAVEKDKLLEELNNRLEILRHTLQETTHVVLSFGTAWGYRHRELDEIVANCLKVSPDKFSRELSQARDIERVIKESIEIIGSINKSVKIIITVSPVRHLRDGMVENNRSKAHLLAAVHNCVEADQNTFYFPSYEIMMDVLRDYRFYSSDMVHPSELGIDFIWEAFSDCWIDPGTVQLQHKIDRIQKDLSHRSFHPESASHQKFLLQLEKKIAEVKKHLPFIDFS